MPDSGAFGLEADADPRTADSVGARLKPLDASDEPTRETLASWLSRFSVRLIGLVTATAMFVISAIMNFRFGLTLGDTELDAYLYGVASLSADAFKALLPFVIIGLWAGRKPLLAIGALCIWALCVCWSMASAIGFASSTRDVTTAERAATADERRVLTERAERLEQQIALLPTHRPAAVVQAEIDNATIPRNIWVRTSQCTDVTRPDSLEACQPVLELRQELAVAEQGADLDSRLAETRRELGAVEVVGKSPDPQAETIARVAQWTDDSVSVAEVKVVLAVLITVLIEAGSSLGFTLVALGARDLPRRMAGRKLDRHERRLMRKARREQAEVRLALARAEALAQKRQLEQEIAEKLVGSSPLPAEPGMSAASAGAPTAALTAASAALSGRWTPQPPNLNLPGARPEADATPTPLAPGVKAEPPISAPGPAPKTEPKTEPTERRAEPPLTSTPTAPPPAPAAAASAKETPKIAAAETPAAAAPSRTAPTASVRAPRAPKRPNAEGPSSAPGSAASADAERADTGAGAAAKPAQTIAADPSAASTGTEAAAQISRPRPATPKSHAPRLTSSSAVPGAPARPAGDASAPAHPAAPAESASAPTRPVAPQRPQPRSSAAADATRPRPTLPPRPAPSQKSAAPAQKAARPTPPSAPSRPQTTETRPTPAPTRPQAAAPRPTASTATQAPKSAAGPRATGAAAGRPVAAGAADGGRPKVSLDREATRKNRVRGLSGSGLLPDRKRGA